MAQASPPWGLSAAQQKSIERFIDGESASEETRTKRNWITNVWWGTSAFSCRAEVKQMCRGTIDGRAATAWDSVNKLWGTHSLENVHILITSGLWKPYGIDPNLSNAIADKIASLLADKNDHANKRQKTEKISEGGVVKMHTRAQEFTMLDACINTTHRKRTQKITKVFKCPLCLFTPLEQFLECECGDEEARRWRMCVACDVVCHPTKIPCGC